MKIEEEVLDKPITMPYEIEVYCDNDWQSTNKTVSLICYPLMREMDGFVSRVWGKSYTLELSEHPRGPKQREAVKYLITLEDDGESFSWGWNEFVANMSVLEDAPQVIQDFMATLPARTLAHV